jgi:succinoglycan biosynthesis protein ExoA
LPALVYAMLIVVVGLGRAGGRGWRDKLWTMAVLPTMHLAWGWGFVIGVVRGARDTVDTSRLGTRNTPLP